MSTIVFTPTTSTQNVSPLQPEETSSADKVQKIFWTAITTIITLFQILTTPLYYLFDEGLAHLLGLQVLRHGTTFGNYVNIMQYGTDPELGGSGLGSSRGFGLFAPEGGERFQEACQGFFHVFKDTDAMPVSTIIVSDGQGNVIRREENPKTSFSDFATAQATVRLGPTLHAFFSGMSSWDNDSENPNLLKKIAGGAVGLTTPTLRFKFADREIEQVFEGDPDYSGFALRTHETLSSDRLGIWGSLKHGLTTDLPTRIAQHPGRVLLGLMELSAAVALSILCVSLIAPAFIAFV